MKVFVNYKRNASPDEELAERLESALAQRGHEVFRDRTAIDPGMQWASRIQTAIEGCDVMLSLVSNTSLRSGWVLNEIDHARKKHKRLVPVILETLDESLEFQEFVPRFLRIQHYAFTGDIGRAATDICSRLEAPALDSWDDLIGRHPAPEDVFDDTENPAWRDDLSEVPPQNPGGTYRLTLANCFLLALRRSTFYQRIVRSRAEGQVSDQPQVPEPVVRSFLQAMFLQVSAGYSVTSAFAQPTVSGRWRPDGAAIPSYSQLIVCQAAINCERERATTNEFLAQLANASFRAGLRAGDTVAAANRALELGRLALMRAEEAAGDAMDQFKVLVLGVPHDVSISIDHDELIGSLTFRPVRGDLVALDTSLAALGERPLEERTALLKSIRRELLELIHAAAEATQALDTLAGEERQPVETEPAAEQAQRPARSNQLRSLHAQLDSTSLPEPPSAAEQIPPPEVSLAVETDNLRNIVNELRSVLNNEAGADVLNDWHTLSVEQALTLALSRRNDRQILNCDASLRRRLQHTVSHLLRTLQRLHRRLDVTSREFAQTATLLRAQMAGHRHGVTSFDSASGTTQSLQESRLRLAQSAVEYFVARLTLAAELGLLHVDETGSWRIDSLVPAAG